MKAAFLAALLCAVCLAAGVDRAKMEKDFVARCENISADSWKMAGGKDAAGLKAFCECNAKKGIAALSKEDLADMEHADAKERYDMIEGHAAGCLESAAKKSTAKYGEFPLFIVAVSYDNCVDAGEDATVLSASFCGCYTKSFFKKFTLKDAIAADNKPSPDNMQAMMSDPSMKKVFDAGGAASQECQAKR